jgi:hypothetical protein
MVTWEPIETAPTSGKNVLVFTEQLTVRVAYYDSHRGWLALPGHLRIDPTHWMELPERPQTTASRSHNLRTGD